MTQTTHSASVTNDLKALREEYAQVRGELVAELDDLDAGIARLDVALGSNGQRPTSAATRKKRPKARKPQTNGAAQTSASDLESLVLRVVREAKQPLSASEIAAKGNVLDGTARRYIAGLLSQGKLRKAGMSKGPGRAAQLYKVK